MLARCLCSGLKCLTFGRIYGEGEFVIVVMSTGGAIGERSTVIGGDKGGWNGRGEEDLR